MSTYKFQNVRARKLARHKNSVPSEEIDDEPVEKTESKWSEIGLQKCYWVSVDIKNSSSAGDALTILMHGCIHKHCVWNVSAGLELGYLFV